MNNELLDAPNSGNRSLFQEAAQSVSLKLGLIVLIAFGHCWFLFANKALMLNLLPTFFLLLFGYFLFSFLSLVILTFLIAVLNAFSNAVFLERLKNCDLLSVHIFLNTMLFFAVGLIAFVSVLINLEGSLQ